MCEARPVLAPDFSVIHYYTKFGMVSDIGGMYERFGELEKAGEFYNRSLIIQRSITEQTRICQVLDRLGMIYTFQGKLRKAIGCFRESSRIAQIEGSIQEAQKALFGMELAYIYRGDWKRAEESFMKALGIRDGNTEAIIKTHLNANYDGIVSGLFDLSLGYILSGRLEEAQRYLELVQQYATKFNDHWRLGLAIYNLGEVFREQRNWTKALDYFNQSLQLFVSVGASLSIGVVFKSWGIVLQSIGKLEEAHEFLERSLLIAKRAGSQLEVGRILYSLGNLYLDLNDQEKTYYYYNESRVLAKQFECHFAEAEALEGLCRWALSIGDWTKLSSYTDEAKALAGKYRFNSILARVSVSRADAKLAQGDYNESCFWYAEACIFAFKHHRSLLNEIVEHIRQKLTTLAQTFPLEEATQLFISDLAEKDFQVKDEVVSLMIHYQ